MFKSQPAMSVWMCPLSGNYEFMNVTKTQFKIKQSKIALKETPTLKLGLTPVLTVTQVWIFAERPVCQLNA